MKRILFIAPASIPMNGPEAICNVKILKVLSSMGYQIDLISKDVYNSLYPSVFEINDLKLNSVKIIRVNNNIGIKSIVEHLLCLFKTGFVYKGSHWAYYAIKYAESLIRMYSYDYIFTRNTPSELVGVYLSKKYNIKLIVNFNDPYPTERYPAPYGLGITCQINFFRQRLLNELSTQAYLFSFPCDRLRNYMLKSLHGVARNKTFLTPHIVEEIKKNDTNNAVTYDDVKMVYLGDISFPRDPETFLLALQRFVDRGERIYVDFIGRHDQNLTQLIQTLGLAEYVKIIPSLNYFDAQKILKNYNIALIIEAPCKEGIFLPTKVSDYLQQNIKIFSCSPSNGVLYDLYVDHIIDYFADVTSVDMIFNEISKINKDSAVCPIGSVKDCTSMSLDFVKKTYQKYL